MQTIRVRHEAHPTQGAYWQLDAQRPPSRRFVRDPDELTVPVDELPVPPFSAGGRIEATPELRKAMHVREWAVISDAGLLMLAVERVRRAMLQPEPIARA